MALKPHCRSRDGKLAAVLGKAKILGLDIRFLKKKFGPAHKQNRIFINSRKCQVMIAAAPSLEAYGRSIMLNAPKSAWPEFLIYVTNQSATGEPGVLVIPRDRVAEAAGEIDLDRAARYAERWDLLAKRSTQQACD